MFKVRKWRELNNDLYTKSEEIFKKANDDIAEQRLRIKEERELNDEIKKAILKLGRDPDPDVIKKLTRSMKGHGSDSEDTDEDCVKVLIDETAPQRVYDQKKWKRAHGFIQKV